MKRFTEEEVKLIESCLEVCLDSSLDVVEEYRNGFGHTPECATRAFRNAVAISDILDKFDK